MKTIDPIQSKTTISNKFLEGAYAVLRPLRRIPDPLAVFARLTDDGRRPRTVIAGNSAGNGDGQSARNGKGMR